jgi:hypothetical protein
VRCAYLGQRLERITLGPGASSPAYVRISLPRVADATGEAGRDASASFVVPAPRAGSTLEFGLSAGGCSSDSRRVFVYRPVGE